MPSPLVITLPAGDDELRAEIEQHLAANAEVQTAPPQFGLPETVLIVELIAAATGTVASVTQIAQFLLDLRDRYKERGELSGVRVGKLDGQSVALEDADDALLRRLIEGEDAA